MKIPLARLAIERGTKRKRIVFAPAPDPRKMDEVRLYRIYMRVVNMWRDVAKPRIMAEYQRTIDMRALFDSAESVDDAIQQEASAVSRLFITLELAIRDWSVEIEKWHRGKWRGATLSATGVDIGVMLQAQDVQQTLESVIRTNVALIKDVSAQQQREFVRIIHNGLSQRLTARQVAKELEAVYALGRKRSILIASDQLQKAAVALDRERQFQAGGGREFVWQHSGKLHFRPWHKARNGLTFKYAGKPGDEGYVPPDDLPGIPIRCFPSWQPVNFHDDVFVAYRRWHSDQLTTIVTETGEHLSATPNHPVLTRKGWKPIQSLNVGDYVAHASRTGLDAFGMDIVKMQPRIGDLFEACKAVSIPVTTNGLSGDFHGDATPNEHIEIVNIKGGLRNEIKSACSEGLAKFFLENAVPAFVELAGLGIGEPMDMRDRLSPDGIVSRLRLLEALCWRQISPDDISGLACASKIYTGLFEAVSDARAGYAEPFGDTLDALACHVGGNRGVAIKLLSVACRALDLLAGSPSAPGLEVADQATNAETSQGGGVGKEHAGFELTYYRVENIVTRTWTGHVYNLQTGCGWYLAGSTGVVNCGCRARFVLDLERIPDE